MPSQSSPLRTMCVCVSLFAALALSVPPASAQSQLSAAPARIVQAIDPSKRVVLAGNTYPLARPQFDSGVAPANLAMQRMLLVLRRSPVQEAALDQLLQDQQNSDSGNYHAWLTPQQFGVQFGPAPQDIQTVVSWLESQGFTVNRIANGTTVIEFSGTAGEVQSAFGTAIHKYIVNGAQHWANASDPSIPAALAPVVAGVEALHNFPRRAMHVVSGVYSKDGSTGQVKLVRSAQPNFTLSCGTSSSGTPITCYGLGPYDFATIYNVLPLWSGTPAIDGTGETIAVIGETDVDVKDIEGFESLFGLPAKDPVIVLDGPDPGVSPGDETESDLDLEWAGSVAKGATVKFVIAASTNTSFGVDLAAQYAVDQNIAPIISESYGVCEAALGSSGNLFFKNLWQQAAAQGITVILAAGDSGSAGCDSQDNSPPAPAQFGLQVSGFASTPYDTAVGGTDFNDLSSPASYWSTTNAGTTDESAKGYIPEVPWNDTCTSPALQFFKYSTSAIANCNNSTLLDEVVWTVGGGGGKSSCISGDGQDVGSCNGGYAKPAWQAGKGVPADGARDIPDVSLYASSGFFTNSFYIICEADFTDGNYCGPGNYEFLGVGGTSASAPSFAGIMAMVDEKTGSRQGNANYVLYNLAAQSGASCTSAANPAGTCTFYDITTGTNAMPCEGAINCSNQGALGVGILPGYASAAGYDEATGLGSVNAANLVKNWAAITLKPSATTLALSPTTSIVHGSAVSVTIGVTAVSPATGTPTGTVSLLSTSALDPGVTSFPLSTGAVSSSTNVLPGGNYNVTAYYPGDGTFAASTSPAVAITVTPEPSTVTVSAITQNAQGAISTFAGGPYGANPVYPRVDVTGKSENGFPSGSVTLKDNGNAINGGLTLALNSQGNALPTNAIYTFAAGAHSLSATYTGDASFNSSASTTPATFTITQAATSAAAPSTGAAAIPLGSSATLSAAVTATSCGNLPGGTITFFDGATQVGTAQTVHASVGSNCYVQATASVSSSAFTLGANSITYKYSGDTNYAASTSAATPLDAQIATTTAITTSAASFQQGQSVTFTVNVTPKQAGGPTPTGTVTFTTSGPGVSLPNATLSNGQAQLVTTALPAGTTAVYANYAGDANYSSSSNNVAEQVTPGPDFGVTFSPVVVNITSPGGTGMTQASVTGTNGFNSSVTFSATCSGLPSESACSFSPTTVATGSSTMLTITTTAPSLLLPANRPGSGPAGMLALSAAEFARRFAEQSARHPAALIVSLLLLALLAAQLRRQHLRWAVPVLLLAMLVANAACGGGGGGGGGTSNPGTPKVQNQPITVTVNSGTTTHTFSFTLNVN